MTNDLITIDDTDVEDELKGNLLLGSVDQVLNWARSSSLWPVMFGLACCAIEMIATATSRYAIARGAIPEGSFLNVNVPPRALDDLDGVAITRIAPGGYMHLAESGDGVHERLEREIVADTRHAHAGTDIRAVIDGSHTKPTSSSSPRRRTRCSLNCERSKRQGRQALSLVTPSVSFSYGFVSPKWNATPKMSLNRST